MSFQKAETSSFNDMDDFMVDMLNSPKNLKIIDVGDLKATERTTNGYKFFYITLQDVDTSKKIKLSYNVKINEDSSIYIGQGAKIYPLLSYVSHITDEGIVCFKEDIDDALDGLTFKGKSIRKKFGGKKYFVLVPIVEGDE